MTYEPTTWAPGVSGTEITAARLNNIESGLAAVHTAVYLPPPTGGNDTTAIQSVVNTVPSGGTLHVGAAYRIDGQINIATPMTIQGAGRGCGFYSGVGTGSQVMLNVTSSGVHLSGLMIKHAQFAAAANQTCVQFMGTSGTAPITDVSVESCQITRSGKYAIFAQYVSEFAFDKNVIRDHCYAGIAMLSCSSGSADNNRVGNITMTGYTRSYGIFATRASVDLSSADPRSTDISISNNTVFDITGWDGINTHAGQNITISGNVVRNVLKPIEIVACPNTAGVNVYAPLEVAVIGNTITSSVTDGSLGAGITFVGAQGANVVGTVPEYGTGLISGNTVRGHGDQSSSLSGAILAYYTQGLTITNNTIIEPSPHGVYLYHDNAGFVCTGNTVIDPWTTAGAIASAVASGSDYNVGHIGTNAILRNAKSATLVASRGIYISSQSNTRITLGPNDMAAAATPVSDSGARATTTTANLGAWRPVDNSFIACDIDPMVANSTLLVPTAGVLYLRKMKMSVDSAITNVLMSVSGAGATLSNSYVGVFDEGGNLLATSADASTALQSTGFKTFTLVTPTAAIAAGTWVYVGLVVGSGGTLPTLRAAGVSAHALGIPSASEFRWGSILTGLTALPSSFTPGSVASLNSSAAPLFALS